MNLCGILALLQYSTDRARLIHQTDCRSWNHLQEILECAQRRGCWISWFHLLLDWGCYHQVFYGREDRSWILEDSLGGFPPDKFSIGFSKIVSDRLDSWKNQNGCIHLSIKSRFIDWGRESERGGGNSIDAVVIGESDPRSCRLDPAASILHSIVSFSSFRFCSGTFSLLSSIGSVLGSILGAFSDSGRSFQRILQRPHRIIETVLEIPRKRLK